MKATKNAHPEEDEQKELENLKKICDIKNITAAIVENYRLLFDSNYISDETKKAVQNALRALCAAISEEIMK